MNEAPLSLSSFVALRLYTGPMYIKYNTLLRSQSGIAPDLEATTAAWCLGNFYGTTMHVITVGIVQLGKIMKAVTLYR